MIRIAAVGDVHYDQHSQGRLSPFLTDISNRSDLLILAGDLTQIGTVEEIEPLAEDLLHVGIPIIAVFGNHDYHAGQQDQLARILTQAGVIVLEGSAVRIGVGSSSVGVMGLKGFGGGFVGACGTDFGEPEMKNFIRFTKLQADLLRDGLQTLDTDFKVAVTHYSPTEDTLLGEKKEIYPFLGSYLLAEAIDQGQADIAFHGHAHHGVERGATPGGIPVRNVALPVIRHAFNVYHLQQKIV